MAKKEERFEVTFRDGSQLKDEGFRQIRLQAAAYNGSVVKTKI